MTGRSHTHDANTVGLLGRYCILVGTIPASPWASLMCERCTGEVTDVHDFAYLIQWLVKVVVERGIGLAENSSLMDYCNKRPLRNVQRHTLVSFHRDYIGGVINGDNN